MPSTDREIFVYFRSNPQTPPEIDNLAYASYAFHKYEWMTRFEELNNRPPDVGEENNWISHLPESRLDEILQEAYRFFDFAARTYLKKEIEEQRQDAVDSSILNQIVRATSFKNTFLPNLVIGLVASLVFSVLVIVMGLVYAHDPSPIALYKAIVPHPSAPPSPGQQ